MRVWALAILFLSQPASCDMSQVVRYFHGINDRCPFEEIEGPFNGTSIRCVPFGLQIFGSPEKDYQTACDFLMAEEEALKGGFTLIGVSQGTMLARAVLQWCPVGRFVRSLITIGAPANGIIVPSVPRAGCLQRLLASLCDWSFFRSFVFPCGYVRKDLTPLSLQDPATPPPPGGPQSFVQRLNNEREVDQQSRERVAGLDLYLNLVFQDDSLVRPACSGSYCYFSDSSHEGTVDLTHMKTFKEDSFGLRSLFEKRKFFSCRTTGDHMDLPGHVVKTFVRNFTFWPGQEYEYTKYASELVKHCDDGAGGPVFEPVPASADI